MVSVVPAVVEPVTLIVPVAPVDKVVVPVPLLVTAPVRLRTAPLSVSEKDLPVATVTPVMPTGVEVSVRVTLLLPVLELTEVAEVLAVTAPLVEPTASV